MFNIAIDPATAEMAIETNLKQFLLVLSVSLSVATLPRVFSWFRRISYTLLLVIVGLAFVDVRLVDLSPALILFICNRPNFRDCAVSRIRCRQSS